MSQQNKYLEIERRWLLKDLPGLEVLASTRIGVECFELETVYILNDPELEVRIKRKYSYQNPKITYSVVTKLGAGLTRQESPKLFATSTLFNYYKTVLGKPYLSKVHRDIVLPSGQKWEISLYEHPETIYGLVIAEMEFETEEAAKKFSEQDFPDWLKPLVVKEVTEDPRYNGKNLAVHGRQNPE